MDARDLLKQLIDRAPFHGSQAEFARAIKRNPSQVNQWLSGHRRLDLKGQKIIEDALHMTGYFTAQVLHEPPARYATNLTSIAHAAHPVTSEIIHMLNATDDTGKQMALAAIKVALHGYKPKTANRAG